MGWRDDDWESTPRNAYTGARGWGRKAQISGATFRTFFDFAGLAETEYNPDGTYTIKKIVFRDCEFYRSVNLSTFFDDCEFQNCKFFNHDD